MNKFISSLFLVSATLLAAGGNSFIGITERDLTPDRVSALNLNNINGAEIVAVASGAPASRAGLKQADVIVRFNGLVVNDAEQLKLYIRQTPAGDVVRLGIMRNGQPMQASVQTAASAPQSPALVRSQTQSLPTIGAAEPSVGEKCAGGAGNALMVATIVTALACGVDFFFTGGALCAVSLANAVPTAATAAVAGCAVGAVTSPQTGASAGLSAAHIQLVQ